MYVHGSWRLLNVKEVRGAYVYVCAYIVVCARYVCVCGCVFVHVFYKYANTA